MLPYAEYINTFSLLITRRKVGALRNGAVLPLAYANYSFVCLSPKRTCRAMA